MVQFGKKDGKLIGDSNFSLQSYDRHHDLYKDLKSEKELFIVTASSVAKGDKYLAVLGLSNNKQEWSSGEPISRNELTEIICNLQSVYGDYYGYEIILTKPSFSAD